MSVLLPPPYIFGVKSQVPEQRELGNVGGKAVAFGWLSRLRRLQLGLRESWEMEGGGKKCGKSETKEC